MRLRVFPLARFLRLTDKERVTPLLIQLKRRNGRLGPEMGASPSHPLVHFSRVGWGWIPLELDRDVTRERKSSSGFER